MSKRAATGRWLPLMEYAMKKGVSLSTLRRHIKAAKVEFKVEHGRYLLFDEEAEDPRNVVGLPVSGSAAAAHSNDEVSELRRKLKQAQEEIAELKTLIAFYEEATPSQRLDV